MFLNFNWNFNKIILFISQILNIFINKFLQFTQKFY